MAPDFDDIHRDQLGADSEPNDTPPSTKAKAGELTPQSANEHAELISRLRSPDTEGYSLLKSAITYLSVSTQPPSMERDFRILGSDSVQSSFRIVNTYPTLVWKRVSPLMTVTYEEHRVDGTLALAEGTVELVQGSTLGISCTDGLRTLLATKGATSGIALIALSKRGKRFAKPYPHQKLRCGLDEAERRPIDRSEHIGITLNGLRAEDTEVTFTDVTHTREVEEILSIVLGVTPEGDFIRRVRHEISQDSSVVIFLPGKDSDSRGEEELNGVKIRLRAPTQGVKMEQHSWTLEARFRESSLVAESPNREAVLDFALGLQQGIILALKAKLY